MNRDPFLRLALIVSVTAYAIALAVVWKELGWPAAAAGMAAGPAGAAVLSIEQTSPRQSAGGRRGRFFPDRPRMPFRATFVEDGDE